MRKLRTRIIVSGGVAVFAAATAFAVTNAAVGSTAVNTDALTSTATTVKTGTTLSITGAEPTIKPGEKDTVSGTLLAGGNPAGNKVIDLYRYSYRLHEWRLTKVKLTGTAGTVTFTVQPDITREYELVYHGNSTLAPSTSSAVTITVSPPAPKRVTALSVSAAPTSIAAGHTTRISGVLTTGTRPLAHRGISLYSYDPTTKKWVRVAVELTGPRGGVLFVREPSATATFELVYAGGPRLVAAHSAKVTVTVTG